MASIFSSRNSIAVRSAARAALEAGALGALGAWTAALVWSGPGVRRAVALGAAAAWLASSLGAGALIVAKARSPQAFWWAFGGGMALRGLGLIALVAFSVARPEWSQPGLLLSYALGVLGFLLVEYRHVKDK